MPLDQRCDMNSPPFGATPPALRRGLRPVERAARPRLREAGLLDLEPVSKECV